MHTGTGNIVSHEAIQEMDERERNNYIEVKRDLTRLEEATKQITLYSPCGCGSGKKFKFCCHKP
jgi:uncharacterized protein YchJ